MRCGTSTSARSGGEAGAPLGCDGAPPRPSPPAGPGVYFLLGDDGAVRYVGKAVDLRRRIADHRWRGDVAWEEHADERAALLREADLIVLLRPPDNRSHTDQEPDCFVTFAGSTFTLGRAGDHGTFPHVAKGTHSLVAKPSKAGLTALLRLLWAAQPDAVRGARIPAALGGASPPLRQRLPVRQVHQAPLADLLAGRSDRLLRTLGKAALDHEQPLRSSLVRDVRAARRFYELGPRHLRDLRDRHGLPDGPVPARVLRACLLAEVRATVPTA